MPRISVVIPAYNSARTIEPALRSVAAQTLRPEEILVVDDGSSDDTRGMVSRLAPSLQIPLKLIESEQNRGPAAARNTGMDEASGDWIAFLDADDCWHPEKLRIQVMALDSDDLDMVGCTFGIGTTNAAHPLATDDIASVDTVRFETLVFSNVFATPTVLVRASLKPRFDRSMRHTEDFELWLKLAACGSRIGLIRQNLVFLGKPSFGHAGLSAQLVKMERGELAALARHFGTRPVLISAAMAYSALKFVRRLLIVGWRRVTAPTGSAA